MNECCANCRRRYKLTKFDYSKGGCEHTDMEGYVCMAFANEKQAVWMVGNNEQFALCECFVAEVAEVIKRVPAADVHPVQHGRWETYNAKKCLYTCSECHCMPKDKTPYCPNCGARMDGES